MRTIYPKFYTNFQFLILVQKIQSEAATEKHAKIDLGKGAYKDKGGIII